MTSPALPLSTGPLASRTTRRDLGTRARTESVREMAQRGEDDRVHLAIVEDLDAVRPRTRADCDAIERPCPFVGCRHNLYLDVEGSGSIKYNHPDLEPGDVDPERSCALDIADLGGATLDDLGAIANLTRERIRQIENAALDQLRLLSKFSDTAPSVLREYCDRPGDARGKGNSESAFKPVVDAFVEDETEASDGKVLTGVSFFADGETADADVSHSVWTMFVRWQNGRGFSIETKQQRAVRESKSPWRQQIATDATREPMNEELTPRLRAVLDAYNALAKDGPPAAIDIADRAGIEGANRAARSANVSNALASLRVKGLLPSRGAKVERAPKAKEKETAAPPEAPARESKVPARAPPARAPKRSPDPVIAAMEEKRDAFLAKADALTAAIEAMRS